MIYAVEFPRDVLVLETNHYSSALRKMRKLCASHKDESVYIIDRLCPPYYVYRYVNGTKE